MDKDLSKLYARAIDTPAGKCFCVIISGPDEDRNGFDVTVFHTRSMRTYVGKGLRAPPRWIKPELWMPLALKALASESQPEGVHFNFNPDTGALSWTWAAKEVGMSAGAQQAVMLQRVMEGDSAPLEAMLATVWESCFRLLLSCRQLDTQLQRQSDSLNRTRRELQECTEDHKGLIQELYIKFARVLDAKKDKLIEQQARIRELEEQLKSARQELAEAEEVHTDEEEAEVEETENQKGTQERRRQLQPPQSDREALTNRATPPFPSPAGIPTVATCLQVQANEQYRERKQRMAAAAEQGPGQPRSGFQRVLEHINSSGGSGMVPGAAAAGGAAAGGPAPGNPAVVAPEDMDWDLDVGTANAGMEPQTHNTAIGFGGKVATVSTGAIGAATAAPPGGAYASLGSTQMDDELLEAATQPAMQVAPPQAIAPYQQMQMPPGLAPPASHGVVLPLADRLHHRPQAAGGPSVSDVAPEGAMGRSAADMHPGANTGGGGGVLRGSTGQGDEEEEEDDDDDDAAALGLVVLPRHMGR